MFTKCIATAANVKCLLFVNLRRLHTLYIRRYVAATTGCLRNVATAANVTCLLRNNHVITMSFVFSVLFFVLSYVRFVKYMYECFVSIISCVMGTLQETGPASTKTSRRAQLSFAALNRRNMIFVA